MATKTAATKTAKITAQETFFVIRHKASGHFIDYNELRWGQYYRLNAKSLFTDDIFKFWTGDRASGHASIVGGDHQGNLAAEASRIIKQFIADVAEYGDDSGLDLDADDLTSADFEVLEVHARYEAVESTM